MIALWIKIKNFIKNLIWKKAVNKTFWPKSILKREQQKRKPGHPLRKFHFGTCSPAYTFGQMTKRYN